jgi:hypothetical protein
MPGGRTPGWACGRRQRARGPAGREHAPRVRRAAGLSDEQARALDRIASDYLQAHAAYQQQLAKALLPYKKLSLDMLARDGKISQTTELAAAAQPAEQIRQQMDALADTAMARLRAAFGDEAFARFDAFAKQPKKTAPAKPPGAPAAAGQEVTP